jgi:hypothetical protein
MPINIHVGLSKKVGLPHYSSLAASCNVQIEAEHGLLENQPAEFQGRVCAAFAACRQAVEDELTRQQISHAATLAAGEGHSCAAPPPANGNGNGHAHGDQPPLPAGVRNGVRAASVRQLAYARELAKRIAGLGLHGLDTLVEKSFDKPLAGISRVEGSRLIEILQAIKAGAIDLDVALATDSA